METTKTYTVELTAKEWRIIRLSVSTRLTRLDERSQDVADYEKLLDKLYDDSNYTVIE